MKIYFVVVVV